jgi:glycerol-3-phosphate acyltransferase PlsY
VALTVLGFLAAYLIGAIPVGFLVARAAGGTDSRRAGSGTIGATNVLRTGRKDLAAITLLGDMAKGAAAVLIARWLTNDTAAVVALAGGAAFLGHLFSVWLKFKGGKGVATFFGVLLAAAWPVGVLAGLTWIAVAAIFRTSSLAALSAAALAPVYALVTGQPQPIIWLTVVMGALIYLRHRDNIRRLLKGEEPRIGGKKDAPAA